MKTLDQIPIGNIDMLVQIGGRPSNVYAHAWRRTPKRVYIDRVLGMNGAWLTVQNIIYDVEEVFAWDISREYIDGMCALFNRHTKEYYDFDNKVEEELEVIREKYQPSYREMDERHKLELQAFLQSYA